MMMMTLEMMMMMSLLTGIGFMSPHGSEWPDTEYAYSAEDNSMQESELNTGHLLDILGIVNSNMDVQM